MSFVKITFDDKISILAEVADTDMKKRIGLMWRTEMPDNRGMLFPYKKACNASIWMKNTYIPLNIIFADSDGVIRKIASGEPHCLDTICCDDSGYVVEVNNGFCDKHNLKVGDSISIQNINESNIKLGLNTIANGLEAHGYVSLATHIDELVKNAFSQSNPYYFDYNVGAQYHGLIQSDKQTRAGIANDVRREIAQKLIYDFKHDQAPAINATMENAYRSAMSGEVAGVEKLAELLRGLDGDESGRSLLDSLRTEIYRFMAMVSFILYMSNLEKGVDAEKQIMDVARELSGIYPELISYVEQSINGYKQYLLEQINKKDESDKIENIEKKREKKQTYFRTPYENERDKRFQGVIEQYQRETGKELDSQSETAIEMFREHLLDVYPKEIIPMMKSIIENPYDEISKDVRYKIAAWIKLDSNPFVYDVNEIETAIDMFGDNIKDQPLDKEEKKKMYKAQRAEHQSEAESLGLTLEEYMPEYASKVSGGPDGKIHRMIAYDSEVQPLANKNIEQMVAEIKDHSISGLQSMGVRKLTPSELAPSSTMEAVQMLVASAELRSYAIDQLMELEGGYYQDYEKEPIKSLIKQLYVARSGEITDEEFALHLNEIVSEFLKKARHKRENKKIGYYASIMPYWEKMPGTDKWFNEKIKSGKAVWTEQQLTDRLSVFKTKASKTAWDSMPDELKKIFDRAQDVRV